MARQLLAAGALGVVAVVGSVVPTIATTPGFDLPFPCGQSWVGTTRSNHNPPTGIDFNRPSDDGDVVVASAGGTVTVVDHRHGAYGRLVVIDHGHGWETRYAHLSAVSVVEGRGVGEGDPIGRVGSSGASTGAHLHYEQRFRGRAVRAVLDARETPSVGVRPYARAGC